MAIRLLEVYYCVIHLRGSMIIQAERQLHQSLKAVNREKGKKLRFPVEKSSDEYEPVSSDWRSRCHVASHSSPVTCIAELSLKTIVPFYVRTAVKIETDIGYQMGERVQVLRGKYDSSPSPLFLRGRWTGRDIGLDSYYL
ncbi:hypothetical protein CEXT_8821 [Caerostris extrusa]|uniref:Uncharacterized protein n=1 Tax=Caerostris extrusa TaxID=172846 RepID=A0AAV4QUD8_CAEEX|nr:hypothetical protein CEXT_8821 [Caerostris extrusa]